MKELGEWEPEPEATEETDFGWDEDFSRFESDDIKQVDLYTGFEAKDEFAKKMNEQNEVKEEILYRVFHEHYSPRFTPKMVELFNHLKLAREPETGVVTSLTFDGKEVLRHSGKRYEPTGDKGPFFRFCQEAQEEFDASAEGKYREYREYLEEEEGLGDLPLATLERLYKEHNGAREPTVLSRLEQFKRLVPKGVPFVTVGMVFLASLVAAVVLTKRQSKRATKVIEKAEKDVEKSETIPPLVRPVVRVPIVVAKNVTSTILSYPWLPLVVAAVGVFTLIKYGRSNGRGSGGSV